MAHCYALISKAGETLKGNAQFYAVDEAMCAHFGAEPHPENWFRNWENLVGVPAASGNSWEWMREKCAERNWTEQVEVIDWLAANYNIECWRE